MWITFISPTATTDYIPRRHGARSQSTAENATVCTKILATGSQFAEAIAVPEIILVLYGEPGQQTNTRAFRYASETRGLEEHEPPKYIIVRADEEHKISYFPGEGSLMTCFLVYKRVPGLA